MQCVISIFGDKTWKKQEQYLEFVLNLNSHINVEYYEHNVRQYGKPLKSYIRYSVYTCNCIIILRNKNSHRDSDVFCCVSIDSEYCSSNDTWVVIYTDPVDQVIRKNRRESVRRSLRELQGKARDIIDG